MASKSNKKKDRTVEEFISAPDEVVQNPREAKKLRERKARDDARLERERRSKLKKPPSLEDVLGDVVRCAEDESTNPWHEFRAISKRRYELYGHYPIEQVLKFGRFEHVKQMAGLADTPGTRMLLNARTHASHAAHDERYMRRYLLPHVGKFPEIQRATSKARMIVSISDTHSLFMDPFTWNAYLAFIEDAQPEVLLYGGDHVDGSEISSHPQVPGHTLPFQMELDCLRAMFAEARARCPRARIVWISSNHFLDRWVRYLTQVARGLANMRTLKLDKILDLDDLDIEIVQPGTFVSPAGQEEKRPRIRLYDRLSATHGTKTCQHAAVAEIREWADSGISGHLHRHTIDMGKAAGLRWCQWMILPGGTIDAAAKYYVKGNVPSWSRGFGVTELMGKSALQHTAVVTTTGEAMCHGFYYAKKGRLPTGIRDVRAYWVRRFGLSRRK